jgi:hypothetical protein
MLNYAMLLGLAPLPAVNAPRRLVTRVTADDILPPEAPKRPRPGCKTAGANAPREDRRIKRGHPLGKPESVARALRMLELLGDQRLSTSVIIRDEIHHATRDALRHILVRMADEGWLIAHMVSRNTDLEWTRGPLAPAPGSTYDSTNKPSAPKPPKVAKLRPSRAKANKPDYTMGKPDTQARIARMMARLGDGEMTTTELVQEELKLVSRAALRHVLQIMERAGWIVVVRQPMHCDRVWVRGPGAPK